MRKRTRLLFRPIVENLYFGLSKPSNADSVYVPAFDRIFLQLAAFYINGLYGDILEFGVLQGYTSRLIAERMKKFNLNKSRLHLFDSFDGLPETTERDKLSYECMNNIWTKGGMGVPEGLDRLIEAKLRKKLSRERVFVVKGYFENTLHGHFDRCNVTKATLVNLDCDLYSSSKFVLMTLFERNMIQDGTLIICDDWLTSFGNPNLGQRKAMQEVLALYPNWEFEKYFNYGIGSQVFIAHDLSIVSGKKL